MSSRDWIGLSGLATGAFTFWAVLSVLLYYLTENSMYHRKIACISWTNFIWLIFSTYSFFFFNFKELCILFFRFNVLGAFSCFLSVLFVCFGDRVLLHCPVGCPGIHCVDQIGLELSLTCLCLMSAGIKGVYHHSYLWCSFKTWFFTASNICLTSHNLRMFPYWW